MPRGARAAHPGALSGHGDRAWTIDVQVDSDGHPHAVFSVHPAASVRSAHRPAASSEGRYYYARFDGTAWQVHFLARAGRPLSRAERFYTGLAALDPHDSSRVIISTDRHPTSRALRSSVRATDADTASCSGSPPMAEPAGRGEPSPPTPRPTTSALSCRRGMASTALLWLRGSYTTYGTTTSTSSASSDRHAGCLDDLSSPSLRTVRSSRCTVVVWTATRRSPVCLRTTDRARPPRAGS